MLTSDEELVIFSIWWLRRDLNSAYFPELRQITSKTIPIESLRRILRRLQDTGYIDSRSEGYVLYEIGKEVAWKLVQHAKQHGNMPPRLTYK